MAFLFVVRSLLLLALVGGGCARRVACCCCSEVWLQLQMQAPDVYAARFLLREGGGGGEGLGAPLPHGGRRHHQPAPMREWFSGVALVFFSFLTSS